MDSRLILKNQIHRFFPAILINFLLIFPAEMAICQVYSARAERSGMMSELFVGFDNVSFFKNNEYKGVIADGYTLTGAWVRPKLILSLAGKFELEAGWHYLKYNGADKASVSIPWISSKVKLTRNWQLILGNLNYVNLHNLILPLREPERYWTDKPENGLQFLHRSENLYFDTWVNWEQFIQKNDPFQEHFTFGSSLDLTVLSGNNIKICYPFQILLFHRGGEIDSSPLHVQTFMNMATGLKSTLPIKGFIKNIYFSGYALLFSDFRKNIGLPANNGSGIFITSTADTRLGDFGLFFWKGNRFYSPKGMKLLQSATEDNPGMWVPLQNFLSLNYAFKREVIEGIKAGFRAEGWFDLKTGEFSNAGTVFIQVNQQFLLKEF